MTTGEAGLPPFTPQVSRASALRINGAFMSSADLRDP